MFMLHLHDIINFIKNTEMVVYSDINRVLKSILIELT